MNIEKVIEFIEKYTLDFRNPNLKEFEKSPFYDLFPDENTSNEFLKWPNEYYHNGRFGVYLILDDVFDVIYVGKANNIGKRLGSYFKYNKQNKTCLIRHDSWKKKPKYIFSIAVENETWFECLSLEEYLIWNIQPIDNKRSKKF
jgi:hypothetical protein